MNLLVVVVISMQRFAEAESFEKALSIKSDFENAWVGRGNVLRSLFQVHGADVKGRPGRRRGYIAPSQIARYAHSQ
jgi:hypothetical protein